MFLIKIILMNWEKLIPKNIIEYSLCIPYKCGKLYSIEKFNVSSSFCFDGLEQYPHRSSMDKNRLY